MTISQTADRIISKLGLSPHPEGGFYRRVYCSPISLNAPCDFDFTTSFRPVSTAIYYLLKQEDFSAFHRLKQDEIWHFYRGSSMIISMISPDGHLDKKRLGAEVEKGELPLVVIPRGIWFAAEVKGDFALVGCTVAPGFDFEDFELGQRDALCEAFPLHRELIMKLTRE